MWYVDMVIDIENVNVFINFLVKVINKFKKSTIKRKYDHIEILKVWPYNM